MNRTDFFQLLEDPQKLREISFAELEVLERNFPHFKAIPALLYQKKKMMGIAISPAQLNSWAVMLSASGPIKAYNEAPRFVLDNETYTSAPIFTVETRPGIPVDELTSIELDLQELKRGSTGHTEEILREQIKAAMDKHRERQNEMESEIIADLAEMNNGPTERVQIKWKNVPGITTLEDSIELPEDQLAFLKKKVELFKQKAREEGKPVSESPMPVRMDEENIAEIQGFMKEYKETNSLTDLENKPVIIQIEESITENQLPLSESMADECLKQGYYERAINIYKELGLKNPEKMPYFVQKILDINKKY